MAVARGVLQAVSEGREQEARAVGQALAGGILDDPKHVLARAVLKGGPFAMRKVVELAEVVLAEDDGGLQDDEKAGADER